MLQLDELVLRNGFLQVRRSWPVTSCCSETPIRDVHKSDLYKLIIMYVHILFDMRFHFGLHL